MTDMTRKILYTAILVCVLVSGCVGPMGHLNPFNPTSSEVSQISTNAHDELSEVTGTLDTGNGSDISSEVTISQTGNGWEMEQVFEENGQRVGVLTHDGEDREWVLEETEAEDDIGDGDEVSEDGVMFGETELLYGEPVSVFVGESLLREELSLVVTEEGDNNIIDFEEHLDGEIELDELSEDGTYTVRVVNLSRSSETEDALSDKTRNNTEADETAQVEFVESTGEGELPSRFKEYDATVILDMAESIRNLDGSEYSLKSVNGGSVTAERSTYQIRLTGEDDMRVHVDRENWYPVQVGELRFENVSFTE